MANFCPECGKSTIKIEDGNLLRDACSDGHFITTDETAVGVGALVIHNEQVLLVERKYPQGLWAFPMGWIQYGETLSQAIEREVLEETAITVRAKGILSVSIRSTKTRNEMYMVFLCEYLNGDAKADKREVSQACFVQLDDLDDLQLSVLDKRTIVDYIQNKPGVLQQIEALTDMPTISTYAMSGA